MSHSYIAYIDESGDDGLDKFREPGAEGGASVWLAVTACIKRASIDLEAVGWRDEIVSQRWSRKSFVGPRFLGSPPAPFQCFSVWLTVDRRNFVRNYTQIFGHHFGGKFEH